MNRQYNPAGSEWKGGDYILETWLLGEKQVANCEQAAAESIERSSHFLSAGPVVD